MSNSPKVLGLGTSVRKFDLKKRDVESLQVKTDVKAGVLPTGSGSATSTISDPRCP